MDSKVKKYEQWKRIISIIYLLGYISVSLLLMPSILIEAPGMSPVVVLVVIILTLLIIGAAFFLAYIGFYAMCDHIIETHKIRKCLERQLAIQNPTPIVPSEMSAEDAENYRGNFYFDQDEEEKPKEKKELSTTLQVVIALAIAIPILLIILSIFVRLI